MSLKMSAYVCLAILLQAVYGQSQQCYFCNTEVHGQSCNDPIDASQIQVQRCSDLEIIQTETLTSRFIHFFSHGSVAPKNNISARNTFEDVCIYMTYQFDGRNVSARGCEIDQRSTVIGTLDICTYYSLITPARITNFNCSYCKHNLCNHANFEEVSDESEGSGEPGGAQAVIISLELIVAMLIAKLLFI